MTMTGMNAVDFVNGQETQHGVDQFLMPVKGRNPAAHIIIIHDIRTDAVILFCFSVICVLCVKHSCKNYNLCFPESMQVLSAAPGKPLRFSGRESR